MATDKNAMLSSANYYIGKVTAAKNACDLAAQYMISPQYDVSNNWTGKRECNGDGAQRS